MKKMILLAALTLCASPVYAADRFTEMDKDKNDKVNWEEFEAAMPQMRKSAFESIDTDKDSTISREEWNAFRSTHGAKGGGQPGMPAGMGGMGGKMPPDGMGAKGGGQPGMPMIQPPAQAPAKASAAPVAPASEKPGIMPPKQN